MVPVAWLRLGRLAHSQSPLLTSIHINPRPNSPPPPGKARQSVFIVSKLHPRDHGAAASRAAFERTLKDLDTDYVDLWVSVGVGVVWGGWGWCVT